MGIHKESPAKQATRYLLKDACEHLQRGKLTYLGLPSDEAVDIKLLAPLLENVVCIDVKQAILSETRRNIAHLPLKERRFVVADMWDYLRTSYPSETLVADITFLDFYGGGIRKKDPFAEEIAGLRSYFAKQAAHPGRAFIFGWTFMPRDAGKQVYVEACSKIVRPADLELLMKSTGVQARSVAIRLLIQQSMVEHGMIVKLFHHAVYKRSMNTMILIFSKGVDPQCRLTLKPPQGLLAEPVCVYEVGKVVPRLVPLLSV